MRAGLAWPSAERLPRVLVTSAIAYTVTLAALHVLWILTGAAPWIASFTSLISVFFVLATGLSVVLSLAARRYFGPSDPLRQAWTLLVVASAVRLTLEPIIRHVLGHTTLADAPISHSSCTWGRSLPDQSTPCWWQPRSRASMSAGGCGCWCGRRARRRTPGQRSLHRPISLRSRSGMPLGRHRRHSMSWAGRAIHFSHSCSSKRSCCGVRQWRWAQGWSRGSGERLRPRSS